MKAPPRSSVYAITLGHVIALLRPTTRMQITPETVGAYTLVSKIQKKFYQGNFGVGIYRSGDTLYFIKSWNGRIRCSQYYLLLNEFFINSWLHTKLRETKFHALVSTPRVVDIVRTKNSLSVVFEHIAGATLEVAPQEEREQYVKNIVSALSEVTLRLTPKERRMLPMRGARFHLLSILFASCVAIARLPSAAAVFFRTIIHSMAAYRECREDTLTVAHRDLSASNILVKEGRVYLVDTGALSLTLPGYDAMCVATDRSFGESRAVFSSEKYAPGRTLIRIYVLLHSTLSCITHIREHLPLYLAELSESVRPKSADVLDGIHTTTYPS